MNRISKNFEKVISYKFPFIFLFFCYWINTYSILGSKIIIYLSSEDNFFEYLTFILILLSALNVFRTIFLKKRKNISSKKKLILILLLLLLLFWGIEEISWGQRIFNISWEAVSNINTQSEINFHNLRIFQPHVHKGYYIIGLVLSFACVLKKKSKFSLLPNKSLLYFFLLPSIYYLVGEIILNLEPTIRGAYVLRSNMFYMQEPNEFLLALGSYLYSLNLYRVFKK